MTYALNRFQPPQQKQHKSIVEAIQDAANVATMSGSLATWILRKKKQMEAQERAEVAIKFMAKRIKAKQADEPEESTISPLRRIITKLITFTAKKIFKYIVRPILNFAARVMMNVVRTVLTGLVRMVIVPAIQLVTAFVVANPITFTIGALLLAGGGAYWLWDKFFAEKTPEIKIPEKDIDTRGDPVSVEDLEQEVSVDYYRKPAEVQTSIQEPTELTKSTPIITDAIDYVKTTYKKLTGNQFSGFGNDVDSYIKEAATKYNLPEDVLRGFVKMEGGWTGAMSPTGAIGTGQFIQPTWDALAATSAGAEIGMTRIGRRFRTPQDPRFDKRVNTLATGLLAKQNAAQLIRNGIPLTGENLYMMHNIGPGIIPVMLGREASASTLRAMKQNGMLEGQSAAQFLTYQKGRFNTAYQAANESTKTNSTSPKYTEGQSIASAPKTSVAKSMPATSSSTAYSSNPDKTIVKQGKKLIELGA